MSGSIAVESRAFLTGFGFGVSERSVEPQWPESDVLPAYTTLDAYARIPVSRRFALILRGENLTDETIVTRNQGGSIDLGTPRTGWIGISVSR